MSRLTVSGRRFFRDGQPFFWQADTVWSIFTNAAEEDWQEYLTVRKAQGFNVLQINTLPQWDRIGPDLGYTPYPMAPDGSLDYTAEPDAAWVSHAQKLLRMAVDMGFVPALVVDWCDIVPDNWLSAIFPGHVWPLDAIEKHVQRVVAAYAQYEPVYIVSGDTDFRSDRPVQVYRRTIELLRKLDPEALLTMHLCGERTEIPDGLGDMLDFIMFQSGHGPAGLEKAASMPPVLRAAYPDKPLVNAEPCYEDMPVFGGGWNDPPKQQYTAEQVLEACRRSIMAGADAGITYGANGIWNWRRQPDIAQCPGMYQCTKVWRDALRLPGAERIAELRQLVSE